MKSLRVPSQFNSLFIRYTSTAKSIGLVRVYTEMKINKHEICFDLANFEVSKKYHHFAAKKMNQLLVVGRTYFNNIILKTFYTSEFNKLTVYNNVGQRLF